MDFAEFFKEEGVLQAKKHSRMDGSAIQSIESIPLSVIFAWFLYLWLCVCQYWAASAPLSCSCSLSAIRAMNSLFVGLPLVLDTV